MNRVAAALALGLGLLGFSTDAFADWTVVRSTGLVWLVGPDSSARTPVQGEVVPNAWMVATGPDGRVLLMRGAETINVSPDTQMVVTEHGNTTQIVQPVGTVEFDVQVRAFRHFVVETPVLAAVVKGTHFIVTTDGLRGAVQVERGAVEVKSNGTGQAVLVATGQEVLVADMYAALQLRGMTVALPPAGNGLIPVANAAGGTTPGRDGNVPAVVVDTAAAAVNGAGALVNTLVETTAPVVQTVTEIVEGAGEAVTEIVEETTEVVTEIVDEVLGGLGGLFGGGSSSSSSSSSSS